MNTGSTPDIADRVTAVLLAPLQTLGLDLEGVDLSKAGKRSVLRVAVDKDGGVDMDDIAEATKAVSNVLDDSDVMGSGAFTLEVTSPGVDRPLTLPRHWRRNATRLVHVDLGDGESVTGRIASADDDAAVVEIDGEPRTITYADVAKAKIQIEFKREG